MLIHLSHWETRRSIPVLEKEVGRWWIYNLNHSCTSSSEWNQRPRRLFFRSPKSGSHKGKDLGSTEDIDCVCQSNLWSLSLTRLAVWGRALSCKRMIPSDSIPGRFDFMAGSSTLSHQETNHTSLLFLCLPPFPMLDEHTLHYAHLQSNKETNVCTCAFSLSL